MLTRDHTVQLPVTRLIYKWNEPNLPSNSSGIASLHFGLYSCHSAEGRRLSWLGFLVENMSTFSVSVVLNSE